jgi:Uncharacterized conserved protein (COG2071)
MITLLILTNRVIVIVMITLQGNVERRLLVTYRIDPACVAPLLPAPFEPQTVNGFAVAGICLIRLGQTRPQRLPAFAGVGSESAAHRFAVQWMHDGVYRTGVYIPRRDSASLINVLAGGRIFPGQHQRAAFTVRQSPTEVAVAFESRDGQLSVDVSVAITDELRDSHLFATTTEASHFFRSGSDGYSPTSGGVNGMALRTNAWRVHPTKVNHAHSSFFDDVSRFPAGSIELDSALVMRDIPVEWHSLPRLMPMQPARKDLARYGA